MKGSKEIVLYGVIQLVSGLSQLVYSSLFLEYGLLIFGWVSVALGLLIIVLGLVWMWHTFGRPLGITLLGLSYGLVGAVAVLAGGWLFSPLLILAVIFFAISWGFFKGKTWAWASAILITGLGLLTSIIMTLANVSIPLIGKPPLIPAVLGSAYLLWYFNRPHVTQFFDEPPIIDADDVQDHKGLLLLVTVITLLLAVPLSISYVNPPSDTIISKTWDLYGGPGGSTGIYFSASQDDILSYHFLSTQGSRVRFYISGLVTESGVEGNGSVTVLSTGTYLVGVESIESYHTSVQFEIDGKFLSQRRSIVQWLQLDVYGSITLSILVLTSPRLRNHQ